MCIRDSSFTYLKSLTNLLTIIPILHAKHHILHCVPKNVPLGILSTTCLFTCYHYVCWEKLNMHSNLFPASSLRRRWRCLGFCLCPTVQRHCCKPSGPRWAQTGRHQTGRAGTTDACWRAPWTWSSWSTAAGGRDLRRTSNSATSSTSAEALWATETTRRTATTSPQRRCHCSSETRHVIHVEMKIKKNVKNVKKTKKNVCKRWIKNAADWGKKGSFRGLSGYGD